MEKRLVSAERDETCVGAESVAGQCELGGLRRWRKRCNV